MQEVLLQIDVMEILEYLVNKRILWDHIKYYKYLVKKIGGRERHTHTHKERKRERERDKERERER